MKLRFYKTGFKPEQNGVYESIGDYLSTLTPTRALDDVKTFGYFGLTEVVRLDMDSHDNQFDGVSSIGDYCVAIDDAAEYPATYYYFVTSFNWKAKQTVELELKMDTLTTYWSQIKDNLSPQTHITRQTKNRWLIDGDYAYPVIDSYAEPFDVTFKQTSEDRVYDSKTILQGKWYIVWMSKVFDIQQSTSSAISVTPSSYLLIPEKTKTYSCPRSFYSTITASNIPCGRTGWFAITNALAPNGKIKSKTDDTTLITLSENHWAVIALSESGKLIVQDRSTASSEGTQYEINSAGIYFEGIDVIYRQPGTYPWKTSVYDYSSLVYTNILNVNAEALSSTLQPFSDWYKRNSTDDSIIKIFEYPYCPVDLTEDYDGNIYIDTQRTFVNNNQIQLASDVEFTHELLYGAYPVSKKLSKSEVVHSYETEEASDSDYETKLLNSNYGGYNSYAYDSQEWIVKPELLTSTKDQTIGITQVSSPKSGQIAFKFQTNQSQLQPLDSHLTSQRDNEQTVFNSAYIEYLKYGNALEQKKLRQTAAQGALTGLSTGVGAATTVLLAMGTGAGSGSSAGPVGAIVGAAVGVATAAINIGMQMSRQSDSIQLQRYKSANQASSIGSANDTEIYDALGMQCLKIYSYEPILGKKPLFDFLRLYGYADNAYGIPDLSKRVRFDYCQCEPVFKAKFTWKDREEDIVERMKFGFTVYHYNPQLGTKYDLNKSLENWEREVVEWAEQ